MIATTIVTPTTSVTASVSPTLCTVCTSHNEKRNCDTNGTCVFFVRVAVLGLSLVVLYTSRGGLIGATYRKRKGTGKTGQIRVFGASPPFCNQFVYHVKCGFPHCLEAVTRCRQRRFACVIQGKSTAGLRASEIALKRFGGAGNHARTLGLLPKS